MAISKQKNSLGHASGMLSEGTLSNQSATTEFDGQGESAPIGPPSHGNQSGETPSRSQFFSHNHRLAKNYVINKEITFEVILHRDDKKWQYHCEEDLYFQSFALIEKAPMPKPHG